MHATTTTYLTCIVILHRQLSTIDSHIFSRFQTYFTSKPKAALKSLQHQRGLSLHFPPRFLSSHDHRVVESWFTYGDM